MFRTICSLAVILSFTAICACAQTAEISVYVDEKLAGTVSQADLAGMPHHSVTVKEPKGDLAYEGVLLHDVLAKFGVPFGKDLRGKALSTYVLATAKDGYQVVYALGDLDPAINDLEIVIADKSNGQPLGETQGPFRLIVPHDKKPARSLRMVERIDVVQLRK